MEIRELQSWDDFDGVIDEIVQFRENHKQTISGIPLSQSSFLFRGQANGEWPLETTLERIMGPNYKLLDYYRLISRVKSRIETFTDRTWEIKEIKDFDDWLTKNDFMDLSSIPAYEYMVYLRHHGFPSPLLDWTTSPYVAAYFAFREILSKAEAVAIFVYLQDFGTRGGVSNQPYINPMRSNVRSDQRHFLQQSNYTICTKGAEKDTCYCSHEEAFSNKTVGVHEAGQDMLWKIKIPSSERRKAIKELELYNVNAYSLFPSEESLMETVFMREFFKAFGI
ncbi:MAG: FRG domain-containing protein [Anaerolineales bacterium]